MKTGVPVQKCLGKKVGGKNWKTHRAREESRRVSKAWKKLDITSSWGVITDWKVDTVRGKKAWQSSKRDRELSKRSQREAGVPASILGEPLTLADAGATDPAAEMPRLTTKSLLDVVTATVTGVGRREGMTGRGRSPGRLLPLTTAEAQLWLAPPLWRPEGRMSLRSQGAR